jgi:hypothetical protein
MAQKLKVDLDRQFVALPAEQRAAWEYAMGIISEYNSVQLRNNSRKGARYGRRRVF